MVTAFVVHSPYTEIVSNCKWKKHTFYGDNPHKMYISQKASSHIRSFSVNQRGELVREYVFGK